MDGRQKVLIVDDEELAQDFLRFFLSKRFDVYTVGSVSQFYDIINKVDFDVILMDISLRDTKDGIQLTRELRQSPKHKNIPIFVLTAFNTTKEKSNAEAAGASKFLTKPVDSKLLVKLIDEALAGKIVS